MADPRNDEPVAIPLLDRLILDDGRTALRGRTASLRDVRDSVRRDLENLLNTRWRCTSWPPDLSELNRSLVNYGIPDFTGATFHDPVSQREFARILQRAIEHFEPRLKTVTVGSPSGRYDPQDRTLRFRIDATLRMGGSSEQVSFETALDPSNARFRVATSRR